MQRLYIHSETPQPRHIQQAVAKLKGGGLVVYPTDTTYGLGCDIYSKRSIDLIYQLRGLKRTQPLALICNDLSLIAKYAVVSDKNYRILRHHMPGAYTFVLPASREVPKVLQNKQRQVGVRIPANPVCRMLVEALGHPIISTTVGRLIEGETVSFHDPEEIEESFGRSIEMLLDAGPLYGEPSSVIDLCGDEPQVIRHGAGDVSWLE